MQACDDVEIPVKDSPETPKTPDSPSDISRSVKTSNKQRFLLDPQLVLKTGGFSGYWRTKRNHGPHRDVKAFKPASAEEAKAFLSQISLQLQPRLLVFSSETPSSSSTVKLQGRPGDMPCHGCHGPLGGGAHNGSVPGKDHCTLPHHPSCLGGVVDDKDYRACIDGYVYQPQLVPETGFDHTLSSQDFLATQSQSTPLISGPGTDVNYRQGLSGQDTTHLSSHHMPTPGLSQPAHIINQNMQSQMDDHRAMNQAQSENRDRPSADGLTITDLRADPNQKDLVGDQMVGFREIIPALFAAPTSKVPQPPPLPGVVEGLHHGVHQVEVSSAPQLNTRNTASGSSHDAQQSQFSQAPPVSSQPILDPFGGARQRLQLPPQVSQGQQMGTAGGPPQSYQSAGGGVSHSSQASAGTGPPQPTYGAAGGVSHGGQQHTWSVPHPDQHGPRVVSHAGGYGTHSAPQTSQRGPHLASQSGAGGGVTWSAPHTSQQGPRLVSQIGPQVGQAQNGCRTVPQTSQHVPQPGQESHAGYSHQTLGGGFAPHPVPLAGQQIPRTGSQSGLQHGQMFHAQYNNQTHYTAPHQSNYQGPQVAPGMLPPQQNQQFTGQQYNVQPHWQQQQQFSNGQWQPQFQQGLQQSQSLPGQSSSLPQEYSGQSAVFNSQAPYQTPHGGAASMNDHQIPVLPAPPVGAQSFTPVYDYFVDTNGQTCKVLRQPQFTPPTRTEFRCSPLTGRMFKVQVPVKPMSPPPAKKYEWRCNVQTGERWQVEVPAQPQSAQMSGPLQQFSAQNAGQPQQQLAQGSSQPQQHQSPPWPEVWSPSARCYTSVNVTPVRCSSSAAASPSSTRGTRTAAAS